MKFTDFISPKWKNSNPLIRLKAVKAIDSSNTGLLEKIIAKDDDPRVRVTALNKVEDEAVLKKASEEDPDESVKNIAIQKLDLIFAKKIIIAEDNKIRLKYIDMIKDEAVIASLSSKIDNPDFRVTIVEKISSIDLLCKVAESNCGIKAGNAIVEKVNDLKWLKQISEKASSKKIRKKAMDKLNIINPALFKDDKITKNKENHTPIPEKLCKSPESCVDSDKRNLEKIEPIEPIEPINSKPETLCTENELHKPFLNENEKLAKKLAKTLNMLNEICSSTEDLINSEDPKKIKQQLIYLGKKWKSLYFDSEETRQVNIRFIDTKKRCKEKIDTYEKNQKQKQEERIKNLLLSVKEASEEDDKNLFKKTSEVKNSIKLWELEKENYQFHSIEEKHNSEFQKLCNVFFERLDESRNNRDWELWANLSLKKELCANVEKVAATAIDADELYEHIKFIRDTQTKWKKIGPVSRDKSDEIWNRFNASCDQVFALCLERKNKLLNQLKESVAFPNFNEASKAIKDIQRQWKMLGVLPLSLEKDIREEYDQLCNDFFAKKRDFIQQKDHERQENYKLKLNLCQKAESHLDSKDWHKTTELFKKLQAEWKQTGAVPHEQSNEIWERFSLACDTFFTNLEKNKPLNAIVKTELCEKAEKILESINQENDILEASREIFELQKIWNQTGPTPKEQTELLWKRFRNTCDEIFAIRSQKQEQLSIEHEKNRTAKEILLAQAKTITESSNWKSITDELKAIQEKWKLIGPASRKDENELWTKFRLINDDFFNRRREHFQNIDKNRENNLIKKADLCLTLELLAKISTDNSTSGYNKDVPIAEQLKKAMELRAGLVISEDKKASRTNVMKKVKEIQTEWENTGSVPSDKDNELWQRYKKARALFY